MYEQPKFEEVKIATNQILCASGEGTGEGEEGAPRYNPEW